NRQVGLESEDQKARLDLGKSFKERSRSAGRVKRPLRKGRRGNANDGNYCEKQAERIFQGIHRLAKSSGSTDMPFIAQYGPKDNQKGKHSSTCNGLSTTLLLSGNVEVVRAVCDPPPGGP